LSAPRTVKHTMVYISLYRTVQAPESKHCLIKFSVALFCNSLMNSKFEIQECNWFRLLN
jgi:hypothetical protein